MNSQMGRAEMGQGSLPSFQLLERRATQQVSTAVHPPSGFHPESGALERELRPCSLLTYATCECLEEPNTVDDLNGADVARKFTASSQYVPSLCDRLPDGHNSAATGFLVSCRVGRGKVGRRIHRGVVGTRPGVRQAEAR